MPKLVILRNIKRGNRFFTDFKEGDDPTTLFDGTVAYEIVGYADSSYEIWLQWYGKEVADKLLKESKY